MVPREGGSANEARFFQKIEYRMPTDELDDTTPSPSTEGCFPGCPCRAARILIRQKIGSDVDAEARERRRRIVELVAARRRARAAR